MSSSTSKNSGNVAGGINSTMQQCYRNLTQPSYTEGFTIALIVGGVLILLACFFIATRWNLQDNVWIIGWVLCILGIISIVVALLFKTRIIAPPPPPPISDNSKDYDATKKVLNKVSPELASNFDKLLIELGPMLAPFMAPTAIKFLIKMVKWPLLKYNLSTPKWMAKIGAKGMSAFKAAKGAGAEFMNKIAQQYEKLLAKAAESQMQEILVKAMAKAAEEDVEKVGQALTPEIVKAMKAAVGKGIQAGMSEELDILAEKMIAKQLGKVLATGFAEEISIFVANFLIGVAMAASVVMGVLNVTQMPLLGLQIGNIFAKLDNIGNFNDSMDGNAQLFVTLIYPLIEALKKQQKGMDIFPLANPMTKYHLALSYASNPKMQMPYSYIKENAAALTAEYGAYMKKRLQDIDVLVWRIVWEEISPDPVFIQCNLQSYLMKTFCLYKGHSLNSDDVCIYDRADCIEGADAESPNIWDRREWQTHNYNAWIKNMPDLTTKELSKKTDVYSAAAYPIQTKDKDGNQGVCVIGNQYLRNFCSYPACRPVSGSGISKDSMGFIYDPENPYGVLCSIGIEYCESKGGNPKGCTNSTGGSCFDEQTGACLKGGGEPVASFFVGSTYADEVNATKNLQGSRCWQAAQKAPTDTILEATLITILLVAAGAIAIAASGGLAAPAVAAAAAAAGEGATVTATAGAAAASAAYGTGASLASAMTIGGTSAATMDSAAMLAAAANASMLATEAATISTAAAVAAGTMTSEAAATAVAAAGPAAAAGAVPSLSTGYVAAYSAAVVAGGAAGQVGVDKFAVPPECQIPCPIKPPGGSAAAPKPENTQE